ncbi:MAG: protein kinase [Kofleriaceae bacterium]|nr:protein kinase [Kofleriaceae bacterium]
MQEDHTQTLQPRGGAAPAASDPGPGAVAAGAGAPTPAASGTPNRPDAADGRAASIVLPVDDPDRYEAAGEHARGGLGRVVRALDRRLGRVVAVKELLRTGPLAESLFVREAMITARLQHPGIVPVHEAGRWPGGEPYYVMRLVQGQTLKQLIAERPAVRERFALLHHVIAVADAIGYAHSEQVIHRDIKPSNIIVGPHGETVVVDWGLARDSRREVPEPVLAADADPGPAADVVRGASTVSGRVIGTPAYMAPEQARGEVVDARADVYAIGALLYEILTGTPPYVGEAPQQVVDAVLAGPPPALAEVAAAPADLIAICQKAMARCAADRYPTARELASDLRRFQTGQLVSAQTYSTMRLVRRWMQRHRGAVAVGGVAVLALVIVAASMVRRVVEERNLANHERGRAVAAAAAARDRQAALIRLQARTSLRRDPTATIAWLKADPIWQRDPGPGPATDEVAELVDEAVASGVARHVWRHATWVMDAAFSTDSTALYTATRDGVIRRYGVATGAFEEVARLDGGVMALAVTTTAVGADPPAELLAAGGADGAIGAWDARGRRVLTVHTGCRLADLWFDPSGQTLHVVSEGCTTQAIDVRTGRRRDAGAIAEASVVASAGGRAYAATPRALFAVDQPTRPLWTPARPIRLLAGLPDGTGYLAYDGAQLWEGAAAGGAARALGPVAAGCKFLRVSGDGRWVVAFGDPHDLFVYDRTGRRWQVLRGHLDALYSVDFHRDRLLSASDDGTARVWDLRTGDSITLRGHDDDVHRARFSPDGAWVATASLDGSARAWPIGPGGLAVLGPDQGPIMRIEAMSGGELLARGQGFATRWDGAGQAHALLDRDQVGTIYGKERLPVTTVRSDVAATSDDQAVVLAVAGTAARRLSGHRAWITGLLFSADGATLFSGDKVGQVWTWDVATGTGRLVAELVGPVHGGVELEPGRLMVSVGDQLVVVDTGDGKVVERLATGPEACVRGMRRFGAELMMIRCDGRPQRWRRGEAPVVFDTGRDEPVDVAVSKDGRRLAAAMPDRSIRVWDASTGAAVTTLRGHSDLVMAVAWSEDGRLASGSYDRTARVWDVATGRSRVLRGHGRAVSAVQWEPGDLHLLTGAHDGTLRRWEVPSLAPRSAPAQRRALDEITSAAIAEDRPAT